MKHLKSDVQKSVAALVLVGAMGAFLGVLARYLNTDFTILQQTYVRTAIAVLLAVLFFHRFIRWKQVGKVPRKEWFIVAFRGIAATALGAALFTKAVQLTTLSDAMFIGALPTTPILAFLLLKERVTWWKLAFIVAAFSGAVLVGVNDFQHILSWNIGDLLIIVSDIGFGLSYMAARRYGKTGTLNTYETTAFMLLFGAVSVLALSLSVGETMPTINWSWTLTAALLAGGAIIASIGFFVTYAFKQISGVRGGNLITLETVFGVLFGFVFYREVPSWRGLVGGSIIVASVIAMNIYSGREEATVAAVEEKITPA